MPNTVWIVHEPRIEAEDAPMADHHIEDVIRHRAHGIASELDDQPQSRQILAWTFGAGGTMASAAVVTTASWS